MQAKRVRCSQVGLFCLYSFCGMGLNATAKYDQDTQCPGIPPTRGSEAKKDDSTGKRNQVPTVMTLDPVPETAL